MEIKKMFRRVRATREATLHSRIAEYLEFKMYTVTHSTLVNIKEVVLKFERYVDSRTDRSVGPRMIWSYLVHLKQKGVSDGQVKIHIGMLNNFFGWCVKMGYIEVNPAASFPLSILKIAPPKRLSYSEEEYRVLARGSVGSELHYAIVCAWHTALRISDVCGLKWDEVDLGTGVIVKLPLKTHKTGKLARIPIHPELMEILAARNAARSPGEEYVSDWCYSLFISNQDLLRKRFRALCSRLGVEYKGFHAFRRAALERWMNHPNADVVTVMDMSAHISANTLAKYCKPSIEKKKLIMGIPDENRKPPNRHQIPDRPDVPGNDPRLERQPPDPSVPKGGARLATMADGLEWSGQL